jgi:uncharacterized membrane protein
MPVFGVVAGLAAGAVSGALTDIGINDKTMKQIAESLKPGGAILFVLLHSVTEDKALQALQGLGGKVIQTSLTHEDEARLQAALDAGKTAGA